MLQYILTPSGRFSMAELAQMAIEGGCGWISISASDLSDKELADEIAPDVVDMCRESGVFLTVDDRPETARALGLHGVRLSRNYFLRNPSTTPIALREDLGPEAVIGVETTDPSAMANLKEADIDFVMLPPDFEPSRRNGFISAVRSSGSSIPVVAQGNMTPQEATKAIEDGCNGVAVGAPITNAPDPVVAVESFLKALA